MNHRTVRTEDHRSTAGQYPVAQDEFVSRITSSPLHPVPPAFAGLDMPAPLLAALRAEGVVVPFPIQAAALPDALAGRDVLGRGRSGPGRTLAFGLALLARTAGHRAEPRQPLALVLLPTGETAGQVAATLARYARPLKLRMATAIDGLPIGRQAGALRDGAEIVVATPGRLAELVGRGDCRLDRVGITVLDEADRMADLGLLPQAAELLGRVRPGGQRMLFTATPDRDVDRLVRDHLTDPLVLPALLAAGLSRVATGRDGRQATLGAAA